MTFDGRIESQMTVPAGVSFTATNSGGGPTTVTFPAGTYYPGTLAAQLATRLNAVRTPANWTVSLSTGANGTGKVSINWTGAGTYSIAWTASGTTLRNVLGFTVDLTAVTQGVASVGANQAKGLWIPDCPLVMPGDRKRAPIVSDLRTSTSPRGSVYGFVGNTYARHKALTWQAVSLARIWEVEAAAAGNANGSLETWLKETQLGQGTSWFAVASLMQVYDHSGAQLGIDANGGTGVAGWQMTGASSIDQMVKRLVGQWMGLWTVSIPELVSPG